MSELKAGVIVTPHDEGMCFNRDSDVIAVTERETEFYLKYEADKVIARHKYKRCLAMAEKCKARYDEEDAKVNGCGASWEYISKEMKYWERWRNRWLELAEKFKEEKWLLCQGCIEEMRETYKDVINTKPTKGVIAMACGGKKSGGKKPTKKKG